MTPLEQWQALRDAIWTMTEAAALATPGPWSTPGPDTIAEWSIYADQRGWMVASASVSEEDEWTAPALRGGITGAEANRNAHFIALHHPAWALSVHTDALGRLNRHRPWDVDADEPDPNNDPEFYCGAHDTWILWRRCPDIASLRTTYLGEGEH